MAAFGGGINVLGGGINVSRTENNFYSQSQRQQYSSTSVKPSIPNSSLLEERYKNDVSRLLCAFTEGRQYNYFTLNTKSINIFLLALFSSKEFREAKKITIEDFKKPFKLVIDRLQEINLNENVNQTLEKNINQLLMIAVNFVNVMVLFDVTADDELFEALNKALKTVEMSSDSLMHLIFTAYISDTLKFIQAKSTSTQAESASGKKVDPVQSEAKVLREVIANLASASSVKRDMWEAFGLSESGQTRTADKDEQRKQKLLEQISSLDLDAMPFVVDKESNPYFSLLKREGGWEALKRFIEIRYPNNVSPPEDVSSILLCLNLMPLAYTDLDSKIADEIMHLLASLDSTKQSTLSELFLQRKFLSSSQYLDDTAGSIVKYFLAYLYGKEVWEKVEKDAVDRLRNSSKVFPEFSDSESNASSGSDLSADVKQYADTILKQILRNGLISISELKNPAVLKSFNHFLTFINKSIAYKKHDASIIAGFVLALRDFASLKDSVRSKVSSGFFGEITPNVSFANINILPNKKLSPYAHLSNKKINKIVSDFMYFYNDPTSYEKLEKHKKMYLKLGMIRLAVDPDPKISEAAFNLLFSLKSLDHPLSEMAKAIFLEKKENWSIIGQFFAFVEENELLIKIKESRKIIIFLYILEWKGEWREKVRALDNKLIEDAGLVDKKEFEIISILMANLIKLANYSDKNISIHINEILDKLNLDKSNENLGMFDAIRAGANFAKLQISKNEKIKKSINKFLEYFENSKSYEKQTVLEKMFFKLEVMNLAADPESKELTYEFLRSLKGFSLFKDHPMFAMAESILEEAPNLSIINNFFKLTEHGELKDIMQGFLALYEGGEAWANYRERVQASEEECLTRIGAGLLRLANDQNTEISEPILAFARYLEPNASVSNLVGNTSDKSPWSKNQEASNIAAVILAVEKLLQLNIPSDQGIAAEDIAKFKKTFLVYLQIEDEPNEGQKKIFKADIERFANTGAGSQPIHELSDCLNKAKAWQDRWISKIALVEKKGSASAIKMQDFSELVDKAQAKKKKNRNKLSDIEKVVLKLSPSLEGKEVPVGDGSLGRQIVSALILRLYNQETGKLKPIIEAETASRIMKYIDALAKQRQQINQEENALTLEHFQSESALRTPDVVEVTVALRDFLKIEISSDPEITEEKLKEVKNSLLNHLQNEISEVEQKRVLESDLMRFVNAEDSILAKSVSRLLTYLSKAKLWEKHEISKMAKSILEEADKLPIVEEKFLALDKRDGWEAFASEICNFLKSGKEWKNFFSKKEQEVILKPTGMNSLFFYFIQLLTHQNAEVSKPSNDFFRYFVQWRPWQNSYALGLAEVALALNPLIKYADYLELNGHDKIKSEIDQVIINASIKLNFFFLQDSLNKSEEDKLNELGNSLREIIQKAEKRISEAVLKFLIGVVNAEAWDGHWLLRFAFNFLKEECLSKGSNELSFIRLDELGKSGLKRARLEMLEQELKALRLKAPRRKITSTDFLMR